MSKLLIFLTMGCFFFFPVLPLDFISVGLTINASLVFLFLFYVYYSLKMPGELNKKIILLGKNAAFCIVSIYIIIILTVLGMLVASFKINYIIIINDFFTFAYYLFYLMFLGYGFILGFSYKNVSQMVVKYLLIWGMVSIAFSILLYFNTPAYLFDIIESFWGHQSFLEKRLDAYQGIRAPRLIGLFGNNNYLSAFIIILFWSVLLFFQGKIRFLFLPVIILILFMADSKAGIIIFAVSVIFYLFMFTYIRQKINLKYTGLIIINMLVLSFLVYLAFESLDFMQRFQRTLFEGGVDEYLRSWRLRYGTWSRYYSYFLYSPLVGMGPLKSAMRFMSDNTYLLIATKTGLIGLLVFVFLKLYLLFKMIIIKKESFVDKYNKELTASSGFGAILVILFIFYDITIDYFYHQSLMYFSFFFWGIVIGQKSRLNRMISSTSNYSKR